MTTKVKEYLGRGIIAVLYGGAMTAVLACILGMKLPYMAAFIGAACMAAVFCTGGIRKMTLLITVPASIAAAVLLKIPQACADMMRGEFDPTVISALIGVFFSFVACLFSGQRAGAFMMTVIFGLSVIFSRGSEEALPMWTAACGVIALLAQCAYTTGRKGAQWNAMIPAVLVSAALAFAVTPAEGTYWKPMNDLALRVRDKITELSDILGQYGGFNDDRIAYSVCMDGYQPMVNMLGGPATPSTEPVMDVTASAPVYLRGSIRRYYTGHSWIDDSANNRYVYLDPSRRHIREEIFDTGRAEGTPITAEITFLKASESSALFTPHRLEKLSLDALSMVAYFNSAGEVFLTRPVEEGDTYSLEATCLDISMHPISVPEDGYGDIKDEYTRLPDGIEKDVYTLAGSLSLGAADPIGTAEAIQKWLAENCRYETDVDYPPLDRDFVSYFLLDSREGYCTYFASAFSVLCRMCGIPTRYIEGYLAVPGDDGTVRVTGENAHAWVEIYIQGVGWITADPTAAAMNSTGTESGTSSGEDEPEPPQTENDEAPEDPGEAPETPENEPDEQETGDDETEPDNEPDIPDEEPDDGSDEEPDEPDGEPEPEGGTDDRDSRLPLILTALVLLIIAAAAAAYIAVRLAKTDPARMIKTTRNELDRLAIVYRALLTALECRDIRPQGPETAVAFTERLMNAGILGSDAVLLADMLSGTVYSGREARDGSAEDALAAYERAVKGMKANQKLRWLRRRVFRGIGSIENIP